MASGFQSNYIDSGYSVPADGNYYYNQSGNRITATNIASSDIYNNSQQVGVYMINGNSGSSGSLYPIFCSMKYLQDLGTPNSADDAWLVYPGYGFQLFKNANYTIPNYDNSTYSNIYMNIGPGPAVFYTSTGNFKGTKINQMDSTNTYTGNSTISVKIFFRFQEITITGYS